RTAFDLLRRIGRHFPLFFYLGPIIFITVALSAELISRADGNRVSDWALGLIAIVLLICTSQLAVALVNWLATLLVTSRPLPKMDFSAGIPAESKTVVVVRSMIASPENVDHLAEALEVRFLANRDDHLHFALLTDFLDADAETTTQDDQLLQLAHNKIADL